MDEKYKDDKGVDEKGIEVEATRHGYFGSSRAPGDRFTIPNEKAMGSWMKKVSDIQNPDEPARKPFSKVAP